MDCSCFVRVDCLHGMLNALCFPCLQINCILSKYNKYNNNTINIIPLLSTMHYLTFFFERQFNIKNSSKNFLSLALQHFPLLVCALLLVPFFSSLPLLLPLSSLLNKITLGNAFQLAKADSFMVAASEWLNKYL